MQGLEVFLPNRVGFLSNTFLSSAAIPTFYLSCSNFSLVGLCLFVMVTGVAFV